MILTMAIKGFQIMIEINFPSSISQNNAQMPERHIDVDEFSAHWIIWQTGAIFGFVGGFLAGVSGLILCATTYFVVASITEVNIITNINIIGTCLTISTLPLLTLGAHCLDKIDDLARKKENRLSKKKARFAGAELYQKQ